jgi:hypothetical protein
VKYLALLLLISVAAMASPSLRGVSEGFGSFPETDDTFDSYVYGEDVCSTIPASFGDYRVVDDFVVSANLTVQSFVYWGVTTSSAPTTLNIMAFQDNSGVPGTEIFQTSNPVTTVASGFTFAGYTVWTTTMNVSIDMTPGTYWLGFHRPDATNWYVGLGTTVTGSEAYRTTVAGYSWVPCSSDPTIGPADLFKVISGEYTSLTRSTWAGVKSLF